MQFCNAAQLFCEIASCSFALALQWPQAFCTGAVCLTKVLACWIHASAEGCTAAYVARLRGDSCCATAESRPFLSAVKRSCASKMNCMLLLLLLGICSSSLPSAFPCLSSAPCSVLHFRLATAEPLRIWLYYESSLSEYKHQLPAELQVWVRPGVRNLVCKSTTLEPLMR